MTSKEAPQLAGRRKSGQQSPQRAGLLPLGGDFETLHTPLHTPLRSASCLGLPANVLVGDSTRVLEGQ